jgi:hypothetical protein
MDQKVIDALTLRIDGMTKRISTIVEHQNAMTTRINAMQKRIDDLWTISKPNDQLVSLLHRMNTFEHKFNRVYEKIGKINRVAKQGTEKKTAIATAVEQAEFGTEEA